MKRAAILLASLTLLAACGGSESPEDVLSETATKLGDIRSGDISFTLVVESGERRTGFELDGPFSLAKEGRLPVAEVEYTFLAGEERQTATFISTGTEAFVRIGDEAFQLGEEDVRDLRGRTAGLGEDGGLAQLELDDWIVEPTLSEGEEVGGAETDRVRAKLDVVAAANDLLALVRSFDAGAAPTIEGKSAEQLRRAVRRATIDVLSGTEDRLLRRLVIDMELGAELPKDEFGTLLEDLSQARFRLELEIREPNQPVEVDAPANAQPFESDTDD